jgi:hypothetical protein
MGYAFAAWTVFVWGTRISNIIDDGGAVGGGRALDLAVAGGLTILGLVVAVATWRRRPAWALPALVVATVAVWAVRAPLILLDPDHGAAFKAVHAALAVVSLALAAGAWRTARSRSDRAGARTASGAGRLG